MLSNNVWETAIYLSRHVCMDVHTALICVMMTKSVIEHFDNVQLEFTYPGSQSISVPDCIAKEKVGSNFTCGYIYSCLTLLSTKCSLCTHNSIWSPLHRYSNTFGAKKYVYGAKCAVMYRLFFYISLSPFSFLYSEFFFLLLWFFTHRVDDDVQISRRSEGALWNSS